jgi:hypothetical protein
LQFCAGLAGDIDGWEREVQLVVEHLDKAGLIRLADQFRFGGANYALMAGRTPAQQALKVAYERLRQAPSRRISLDCQTTVAFLAALLGKREEEATAWAAAYALADEMRAIESKYWISYHRAWAAIACRRMAEGRG